MLDDGSDDGSIEAVLDAAAKGDRWALTRLYRTYQPMVVRYLRGRAPGVADDLASDVWLDVARHLGRFSGDERGFRAWLFTIARSRLIGHHRKAARRRTEPVAHDRIEAAAPSDSADPARLVVERLSARQAVDRLVADLTPDQAEAVLLRVVAGFDVGEVARIMGRTPGSIRVLCHRALRRLAHSLSEGVLSQ